MTLSGPPEAEQTILAETVYACTYLWFIHLFTHSFIYSECVVLVGKRSSPGMKPSLELLIL